MNAKQQYILAYRLFRLYRQERTEELKIYNDTFLRKGSVCHELIKEIKSNVNPSIALRALISLNNKAMAG